MKFEIKKIMKHSPLVLVMLMISITSICLFYRCQFQYKQEKEERMNSLIDSIQNYQEAIRTDENGDVLSLQMNIELYQAELEALEKGGSTYLTWILNQTDIFQGETVYSFEIEGAIIPNEVSVASHTLYQTIKDKKIPPMLPLTRVSNFYELGNLDEEGLNEWKKMNKQYANRSFYYFWQQTQQQGVFILILCLVIGLFGAYSQTLSKVHLYQAEGISAVKLFVNHVLAKIIIYFSLAFCVMAIPLVVIGLISGFGSLDYPVLVNTYAMSALSFIPLKSYLVQAIVLFICMSLFIMSCCQWIESLVRHSIISVFIEVIVLLIGFYLLPFIKWNPFAYLHIDRIITAGFGTPYEVGDWSMIHGCLFLVTLTMLLTISNAFFVKKMYK